MRAEGKVRGIRTEPELVALFTVGLGLWRANTTGGTSTAELPPVVAFDLALPCWAHHRDVLLHAESAKATPRSQAEEVLSGVPQSTMARPRREPPAPSDSG